MQDEVHGAVLAQPYSYLARVNEEEADGDHAQGVQRLRQTRDEWAELGPKRAAVGRGGVHEDDALSVVYVNMVGDRCD